MTKIFDRLSVVGDPVAEDRVVHLLASLPDSQYVSYGKHGRAKHGNCDGKFAAPGEETEELSRS